MKHQSSTIASVKIIVRGWERPVGDVVANFGCNPTRTLAHLLHAYPADESFVDRITNLDLATFFGQVEGVPRSLDYADNWLSDINAAHRALGRDVFAVFLSIFVAKLQALTLRLLSPFDGGVETYEDGTAHVASVAGCVVRLEWGAASVPQIETYFERHHSQARTVVRSAAQTILSVLDTASVRHHRNQTSFERAGDLFTLASALPNDRRLVMYAKAERRIRFEVRRHGTGRYPATTLVGAADRLLTILRSERENLLTACTWDVVGDLFVEHSVPVLGDLIRLVSAVSEACALTGEEVEPILSALMIDAGITRTEANGRLVEALQDRGVLERVTLRHRNGPLPHRYALTEDFRSSYNAILTAFSTSEAPTTAGGS